MNILAATTVTLCLATSGFAAPLQVQIASRFEGFAPSPVNGANESEHPAGNLLSSPTVLTKVGQKAVIEIIREVSLPGSAKKKQSINTGVTLEVIPELIDGQLTLTGKSTVRRQLPQKSPQPLGAISFATRETYFSGLSPDGEELKISVGDGEQDKSRILLTVRIISPAAKPAQ